MHLLALLFLLLDHVAQLLHFDLELDWFLYSLKGESMFNLLSLSCFNIFREQVCQAGLLRLASDGLTVVLLYLV